MGLKWVIPGSNTKILAQAIHCLAKLGEDLYIEGLADRLAFRTANLSKTAFASFNFSPDFFSFYPDVGNQDQPRCQIAMKAALVVFRFPSGMDRSVEHCSITLSTNEDRVDFCLKFKQGFVKINKIQLLECEALQASYEDEELPSWVTIEAKTVIDILSSFQGMEITWAILQSGIQFRNFSELTDDDDGLRSEVHLSKDELIEINIAGNAELTFSLAELRTILSFAEHIGCPITINFSESGKPMFLIVRNAILTAHIVLATLGISTSQSTTTTSVCETSRCRPSFEELNELCIENIPEFAEDNEKHVSQERLRYVLTRPGFDISQLPGYDRILAPDSDSEEL